MNLVEGLVRSVAWIGHTYQTSSSSTSGYTHKNGLGQTPSGFLPVGSVSSRDMQQHHHQVDPLSHWPSPTPFSSSISTFADYGSSPEFDVDIPPHEPFSVDPPDPPSLIGLHSASSPVCGIETHSRYVRSVLQGFHGCDHGLEPSLSNNCLSSTLPLFCQLFCQMVWFPARRDSFQNHCSSR